MSFTSVGGENEDAVCLQKGDNWQPRTYFFSDEYYYTYFTFSVLHIQQKLSCL